MKNKFEEIGRYGALSVTYRAERCYLPNLLLVFDDFCCRRPVDVVECPAIGQVDCGQLHERCASERVLLTPV
jgi:hypothetical protein